MANTKITSRVLADNAVLTANITDANVTTAKVADNAVTGDKVADDVALAGNPTTTTQSAGNNTTRIATTAFVSTAVANLADSAPDALNTLNELAAAMGDDANFSTTITNSIAAKLPLAGGTMTGNLAMGSNNITSSGTITGTVATAAQTNITSLGTLTSLTVDEITINADTITATDDFILDVEGEIVLDANNGGQVQLKDNGTEYGRFFQDSNRLFIQSMVGDADILIRGVDGSSTFTALQFDMSDAGKAVFNSGAEFHGLVDNQISHSSTDVTAANSNSTLRLGNSAAGNGIYNAIKFAANQQDMYIMSFNNSAQADRRMGFFLGSVAGDAVADERLSIRGNGSVGIGTTSPSEILHISSPADSYWALKVDNANSNYGIQTVGQGSYAIGILNSSSNSYRGRWSHEGTIYSQDGSVHDVDSDERLKEDITDCPSQWSLIKDLPLQRFKWKDRRNGDTFSYGWIAQPTKAKYPEFVEPIPQPKEDIDEGKEDPEYLTVRSGDIQKRSIAALQEAMARIEALEAEVAALKG